ncbi:MAG: phage holin family protein [Pseudomonadota bacterium]
MNDQQSRSDNARPGLISGLAGIAKNAYGLLLSRIELAALEVSEVRTNLLKLLAVAALGILVGWFAIAYWTVLIVALTWESLGWRILLIFAAAFTLLLAGIVLYLKSMLKDSKLSMPATMAELRNDRDALL